MANIEARRSGTGTVSYRAKVRLRGHPPVSATFARLTDAKRWTQSTEAAIREGRYFKVAEAKRHTLSELIDRYVNEVLAHKGGNASNTRRNLLWWKHEIGTRLLADLTPAVIVECRNKLLAKRTRRGRAMSPSTVVRYMAALSHALNIAVRDWEWLDDSPMRKVSKPKQPRGRERFLSDAERTALLAACKVSKSQFLYAVVVIAISTGMRSGEIMNLRWRQVDLKAGHVLLHDTKNKTSRAVPLAGHALALVEVLSKVRRIDTDLLFPGRDKDTPVDLKKPWTTAVRNAGLEDFRFHDLRHSAASYLAMNGASTVEIAAVLGHKTLQMVKRYAHLTKSHTTEIVTAMNSKIFTEVSNG